MSLKEINTFIIKVLGMEDESKWLSSEKVNIFITVFVTPLIALIGTILNAIIQNENYRTLIAKAIKEDWFIDSLQLLTIVCTILVIYRLRRNILITKVKRQRLFTYIQEKCNLRDQSSENVNNSLHVVEKTMTQFYYVWILLWTVFFIYYGCSLCFNLFDKIGFLSFDENKKMMIQNGFNNFFNYLSSSVMLVLFIVLNSVTVSLKDRKYRNGLVSSVMFIVFFGCVIIFPTLYSYSLHSLSYLKLQLVITFILGLYSAFAFVLVLGKLNTNLQIPRFIFYWLYIYALIQTFQFLLIKSPECHMCCCDGSIMGQLKGFAEKFNLIFQYTTLVGKVFLSLTLLWIVYESKFIYFIIHQSLGITELPYKTSVFKTYMKDTD